MTQEQLIDNLCDCFLHPLARATELRMSFKRVLDEYEAEQWKDCDKGQPELGPKVFGKTSLDPSVERKSIPVIIEDSEGEMYVGNYYWNIIEGKEEYGWESDKDQGYGHFCIKNVSQWRYIPKPKNKK